MTAFENALSALFTNADLGEEATWRAGGTGDGVAVRVIRKRPDQVVNFGASRAIVATTLIDVRANEIASPAEGDTVALAGTTFDIIAQPLIDSLGLVWTCEAAPQS